MGRPGAWSEVDTQILIDDLGIVVPEGPTGLFEVSLPNRTPAQIRDKVRLLLASGFLVRAEVNFGDTDPPDMIYVSSDDSDGVSVSDPDSPPVLLGDELVDDFRGFWLGGEYSHPLALVLHAHWSLVPFPDPVWIDDFVSQVTLSLLGNNVQGGPHRAPRGVNRAARKRRRYADTQEMFKRCPSRIAECLRREVPVSGSAGLSTPIHRALGYAWRVYFLASEGCSFGAGLGGLEF